MQRDFNNFTMDIKIGGLSEFDQVYANIVKERDQRIAAVDEWKINLLMPQLKRSSYMNVP